MFTSIGFDFIKLQKKNGKSYYNVPISEVTEQITQTCPCNILQYFTAVKNGYFQMKKCEIFLIFAQNIDRGYTLEPPR